MKQNFNDCLNRLLKDEGGYTNDPNDNGGPTNFGVTIIDVRKYVKKDATTQDVRNLTVDQAKGIYQSKYWNALGCDSLTSGVDYTCFDYGVNSGLGRPRKALQRFKSLKGVDLINAINNERTAFLQALAASQAHDQKFLKGWLARVERVRSYSKQLAQKDNLSGVGAGTAVLGGTGLIVYLGKFWHAHELLILGGFGVAIAAVVGTLIHIYKNKGK